VPAAVPAASRLRRVPEVEREHAGDRGVDRPHQPGHRRGEPRDAEEGTFDRYPKKGERRHAPPSVPFGLSH
jgi:hypothetical protein